MIKRTLFFSQPWYLSFKSNNLVITDTETGEMTQAPIEDIGFIVIEHPRVMFTQYLMARLISNNVGVVLCDEKHMPASMLLHLDTNQVQGERFRSQIDAGAPLKKNLWRQIIRAKIRNQKLLLEKLNRDTGNLSALEKDVKSGDTTNREAAASRHYWASIFHIEGFKRKREGEPPNLLLNYGYTILRAAVARALSGSGLLPTLGIHHRNRYNAYCLADDMMEPYRPFVDETVVELVESGDQYQELTTDIKKELLGILTCDTMPKKELKPLMVSLSHTSASLAKCMEEKAKNLVFPEIST